VRLRFVGVTLLLVVVGALATFALSSARYGGSWVVSASQAASAPPGRELSLEGVVLSTHTRDGRTTISVANSTGAGVQRLSLEYSGTQRVHFTPGVIVIAHGRMRPDGIFEVEEFVLKNPAGWAG